MRKLSLWAKKNPAKARTIIVLSHILLVLTALFLGFLTYAFDFKLPYWLLILLANVFFAAHFFYPRKNQRKGWFRYSYTKQKSLDFVLAISYALVITIGFNNFAFGPSPSQLTTTEMSQPKARLIVYKISPKPEVNEKKAQRVERRATIKQFKQNIRVEIKKMKQETKGQRDTGGILVLKILLILMTFVVALGLAYLVAILACSVACSGQGALAWLIAIVGAVGIVWLGVIAIKAILRDV